jgi:hypothetical protein
MKTKSVASSRWLTPAGPADLGIAGLAGTGSGVLLWLLSADGSRTAASLVAATALVAILGLVWHVSRARADRRWRAALDRYAEGEEAKMTHLRKDFHAHPQSQAW